MLDLETLESLRELTDEHAEQAARSALEIRQLLSRASRIAKAGDGCPKVLMAVARLVGQDWVEGELRIELSGDDASTTLVVLCEYGAGIRERLLPATRFEVPIDEFDRALQLAPKLMHPLHLSSDSGSLVLTARAAPGVASPAATAAPLTVDGSSLGDGERQTAPPPADELVVVDEAMPEDFGPPRPTPSPPRETAPVASGRPASRPLVWPSNAGRDIHTCPTVRRMVAVDVATADALRRRDPRREDEE